MQEENLAKGMHDGEVLWVCDLRYRDYADKPIRHIKPTKVLVRSNKKLEGKKKIYYSDSHFVAFGKGDKLTKKVIALFDNTGYKWRTGTSLRCFDNEQECIKCYNRQVRDAVAGMIVYRDYVLADINQKIDTTPHLTIRP